MKRYRKTLVAAVLSLAVAAAAVVMPIALPSASAQFKSGLDAARTQEMSTKPIGTTIGEVVNIFLYFVGAVAVIVVIWGGFQYITSSGDSQKATTAKNTIMYAVIGLVVAIFAYAIVNFVLVTSTGVGS